VRVNRKTGEGRRKDKELPMLKKMRLIFQRNLSFSLSNELYLTWYAQSEILTILSLLKIIFSRFLSCWRGVVKVYVCIYLFLRRLLNYVINYTCILYEIWLKLVCKEETSFSHAFYTR
jgi:hypothetical protein